MLPYFSNHSFATKGVVLFSFVAVTVIARIVPHPANVTPLTALSLWTGAQYNPKISLVLMLITLLTSDALLAVLYNQAWLDTWSFFTYTGFLSITWLSTRLTKISHLPIYTISASLGYWLWTNFGVWALANHYAKTPAGLINCYVKALPFLTNSIIGDIIWVSLIFGCFLLRFRMSKKKLYYQNQRTH